MRILVTGGAGFIGSALVRYVIENTHHTVLNVDKLTYAGNLSSLDTISLSERYFFERIDICDRHNMTRVFSTFKPDAVVHLAAESHVDKSIHGPENFIQTNIIGTYTLLEVARHYWHSRPTHEQALFRFLHVSTDEVFGSLDNPHDYFTEESPYDPSSPYSASKASADHLVRAWHRTYGLPILITNCSNNYGPYQYPEKLIPLTILNALSGKPLPIYGSGNHIRDWLYVDDHVEALYQVLQQGRVGETYTIGGHQEMTNNAVVECICATLETVRPLKPAGIMAYRDLITYVNDRPGHDARYAIDARKIQTALGWEPQESFKTGIQKTIQWYLANPSFCHNTSQNKECVV